VRIYNESASEPNDYAAPNALASMSDAEIATRVAGIKARSPRKKRKLDPEKGMARRAPQLLAIGTKVRIVSRKWKKAATSLRGNLKYRPKASGELFTVVKHSRRIKDRPLRVHLQDVGGNPVDGTYSIDELVIADTVDAAPDLAGRTRNEGDQRQRRVRSTPLPDLYTGKRLSVRWAPGEWYDATVKKMYRTGQNKNLHQVVFDDEPTKPYVVNLAGYSNLSREYIEGTDFKFL